MRAVAAFIEEHAEEPLSLSRLASEALLSPGHLQRRFKAVFGVSPKAYQDAFRLQRFKGALRAGRSVLESIASAGFGSTSRVYGQATRDLGMTPSAYRAGGEGETVSYACRPTPLGPIMMAATDRGVCFVQFGRSESALLSSLRIELPRATLTPSTMTESPALGDWMEALAAHLEEGSPLPVLPLDLRGTAFQIRVWRLLMQVPEGAVVRYADVARCMGSPGAARAVGACCAANRIALLVPCHRVLRGDGELGGYRWGRERKRSLLDAERTRGSRSPPTSRCIESSSRTGSSSRASEGSAHASRAARRADDPRGSRATRAR